MGNESEYKTFNGQIGKRPTNFCSKPPTAVRVGPGATWMMGFNHLSDVKENSPKLNGEYIHLYATWKQCGEGRQMLELIIQDYR